ncbi:cation acetate symporter, partial [Streptomyces sp. NPDC057067]
MSAAHSSHAVIQLAASTSSTSEHRPRFKTPVAGVVAAPHGLTRGGGPPTHSAAAHYTRGGPVTAAP